MGVLLTVSSLLSSESTGTSNEDSRVVLENDFTARSILGVGDSRDGSGFALVENFSELRGRDESAGSRDRLLDGEVLFTVKKHHRREVREPIDY